MKVQGFLFQTVEEEGLSLEMCEMKNFLILSDAAGSLLNHLTTQFNFELGGDKKTVNLKT